VPTCRPAVPALTAVAVLSLLSIVVRPYRTCVNTCLSRMLLPRRAWIEANRLIRKWGPLSIPADCDRDSPLILNLFVLLVSFFSCDWILLIFLISRLQAEWVAS
jgi:hypothetical protein